MAVIKFTHRHSCIPLIALIVVLVICAWAIDARRLGTSGIRKTVHRPTRTKSRMGGSTGWKVALIAGTLYGSYSYMRRRRYRRHPDREPQICVNNYKKDANGTHFNRFICPMPHQPDDYDYCCGKSNEQWCCQFFDDAGRTAGVVIGILLFCVITAVCCYCCCSRMKGKGSSGSVLSRFSSKNKRPHGRHHEQSIPLKSTAGAHYSDPAPMTMTAIPPPQPQQYDGYSGYPAQGYSPAATNPQPVNMPYPVNPVVPNVNPPYPANPGVSMPQPSPVGFYVDQTVPPPAGYGNSPYPAQAPPPYPL